LALPEKNVQLFFGFSIPDSRFTDSRLVFVSFPDFQIPRRSRQSERAEKPNDDDNNHHNIQDCLDFSIHGNIGINEPQNNPDDDENDDDGNE
jgi:hypothetical protein